MKISVIMQSYLGDYPGSRSNPKEKFIRAVNSFLSQNHKDKELIVVADRCQTTVDIYNAFFKDNPEVKCFYYQDNEERKTYQDEKFWRGSPRQLGIDNASGEIISYLDSDDIILSEHLSNINNKFEELEKNGYHNVKWICNPLFFFNAKVLDYNNFEYMREFFLGLRNFYFYKYGIREEYILASMAKEGEIVTATCAVSHKKSIKTKWLDTDRSTVYSSEDKYFIIRLQSENGPGARFLSPTYIICHLKNYWDD